MRHFVWTSTVSVSAFQLHSNMDKGDGTVKYVLTGDGAGTLFLIDEKSGDIHATKGLDREDKAMYTLHAKVLDRSTNAELEPDTEFNIKIHDINDNEPKFEKQIYFASVPEMSEVGKCGLFTFSRPRFIQETPFRRRGSYLRSRSRRFKWKFWKVPYVMFVQPHWAFITSDAIC